MKILNEALLAEFRRFPCCWCGRPGPSEASHTFAKGQGGCYRLDIRINLTPLCRDCHDSHHWGRHPLRCDLLAIAAAREGTTQDAITIEIYRLRRLAKEKAPGQILGEARRKDAPHPRGRKGDQLRGRGIGPGSKHWLPGLPADQDWVDLL